MKSPKNRTPATPPQTLGEHIKKKRFELGLRQIDLARQWQVDEHSVTQWEQGRVPSDRYLPRILDFLGYDPRPEPRTLGERLVHKRQVLGLSRKAAARVLQVDEGSLAKWEHKARLPTGACLEKIRQFLEPKARE